MGTRDDIAALLDEAQEQIEGLSGAHDAALTDPGKRGRFRARVKGILEHQRSTLDYLAKDLTERFGTPKGRIYYPLAQNDADFEAQMNAKMPGVLSSRSDLADVIGGHQPYQENMEWLRHLNQLTRLQKHNRLALHLIRESYRCRVTEDATGAYVEWHGLTFRPGATPGQTLIESQGAAVDIRPEPGRSPDAPKPLWFGEGPTAITVFGVPIDLTTQQPILDARLTVAYTPIERWFFVTPHAPVIMSLQMFQQGVTQAINEIAAVADS